VSEIIRTPQEWKQSLLDNVADVTLKQITFGSVEDCVDIGTYKGSSAYIIRGSGGCFTHDAGVIYRGFHEPIPEHPTPLVKVPRDGRDWELRFPDGLILDGKSYRGTLLHIEHAQQSRFVDIRVQSSGDGSDEPQFPPVIVEGGTSTFDYLQLFWNRLPMQITGAGVTKIRDLQTVGDWHSRRNAGLHVIAAPHAPPPLGNSLAVCGWIHEPHVENAPLIIEGFDHAVELRGGYYLTAKVHWNRCRHINPDLTPFNSLWFASSEMYRDGTRIK
jgi:hypothetical protein